jgi:uncharacterized protein (DUF1778 family)
LERVPILVRVPEDTLRKVDDAAETLGVSRNAFVCMTLSAAVGDQSDIWSTMRKAFSDAVKPKKQAKARTVSDA